MKRFSHQKTGKWSVLVRATGALLCVLFILGSIVKWKLIGASIISLILTPVVLASFPGDGARYLRIELLQYWIAGVLWLVCVGCLLSRIVSERTVHLPESLLRIRSFSELTLLCILLIALLAPFVAPTDPIAQGNLSSGRLLKPFAQGAAVHSGYVSSEVIQEPSFHSFVHRFLEGSNAILVRGSVEPFQSKSMRFIFGSDDLARDVFSRVIYGMRLSLFVGLASMVASITLGCIVGFTAGISGGWLDKLVSRLIDLFLALPSVFLIITIVAFVGNSLLLLIVTLGVTGWMSVARQVRGEVISLREREFIAAARMLGRTKIQIIMDHVVPNLLPTVVVASVLQFSNVVLAESALSFLGLGIQQPTPSLGNLIGDSLIHGSDAWWLAFAPGLALTFLMISVQYVAAELQRRAEEVAA